MSKKVNYKFRSEEFFSPRNEKERQLVRAFSKLKTDKEIGNFLRDLMTLPEIEEFSNRLEIAKLLLKGGSYKAIADQIGTSTTTVTRVAHWLYKGCGGYLKALK